MSSIQAMLVGDAGGLELRRELGVEDLLEQILEASIVGLEDRVLGRRGRPDTSG